MNPKKRMHMLYECVPLPRELGDMAPVYFKVIHKETQRLSSQRQSLRQRDRRVQRERQTDTEPDTEGQTDTWTYRTETEVQ